MTASSGLFATLAALVPIGLSVPANAAETSVAVAANFTATAREIGAQFAAATGHAATFSFGSTGKLYTQIVNGAPFQVFLAADDEHPRRLEAEGPAVPGSRFTYAVGTLVLWSRDETLVDGEGEVLKTDNFRKLAITNVKTAPYGRAAVEVMRNLGVWEVLQGRIVQGEALTQTYQFIATGNAELGFIALSQVISQPSGSTWVVSRHLHSPIRQDAVLLTRGADNPAARAFVEFLRDPAAVKIIARYGYGTE